MNKFEEMKQAITAYQNRAKSEFRTAMLLLGACAIAIFAAGIVPPPA